jgi:hypothetical protein
MAERDLFEARLAAAVRAVADRAVTQVDAVAVAERAIGRRRRFASLVWLGRPLPVAASLLLVLGLLLVLLAWSVQVGAPWDRRTSIIPLPAPTATHLATPTATPIPSTDGAGAEYVIGHGAFSIAQSGASTLVDGVTQVRGFVATSTDAMNDRRVTGEGTLHLSIDTYDAAGTEWGTYRLENAGGAWEGALTGLAWNGGDASDVCGWLVGSGAYHGYTYYIHVRSTGFGRDIDGIIIPGSPPGSK